MVDAGGGLVGLFKAFGVLRRDWLVDGKHWNAAAIGVAMSTRR